MSPAPPTEKEKMLRGDLYDATGPELTANREHAERLFSRLGSTVDPDERAALLRILLGSFGERSIIRSPFFCDYGYNIHIGRDVFLNFNCILLDVMPIHIGDRTQIGPSVQIYAADHPRDPALRQAGLESGKTVIIGENVWIGGGAILLPGITIGDNAVIGAGSIVTRSVRPGQTVAGSPARPLRTSPGLTGAVESV